MGKLERYEVALRHFEGTRWSLMFDAESFAHAEEQAIDYQRTVASEGYSIIRIERDYA